MSAVNGDLTFARRCLESLAVGTKLFPAKGITGGAGKPADVESIDISNGRAIIFNGDRHSRLCSEAHLALRWDWMGKPLPFPPAPRPETARPRGADNLSPMWAAIRELQEEVAWIKRALDKSDEK